MVEFTFVILITGITAFWLLLKSRNMHIWIVPYIVQKLKSQRKAGHQHVYICLADHYEPYFNNASEQEARRLVDTWVDNYRKISSKHTDSDGNHPKHSYFYPAEEYDDYVMEKLRVICKEDNLGDVDIHLHHDDDTSENLTTTLNDFKNVLYKKHNLLRKDANGDIVYGFIHGNWALDNSRPDGRWCGVDDEIDVLLRTGCVFDMTMPSAPSDTQTKTINSIYFAKEDGKSKSHNTGDLLTMNNWRNNELLMIQGPLELNWTSRKLGIIPRIEAGELSLDAPPSGSRIDLWKKSNITIHGNNEHVFIKIYTHGLQPKNMKMFFEDNGFEKLWSLLESQFRDNKSTSLHYVTAWEMYCKIKELANQS